MNLRWAFFGWVFLCSTAPTWVLASEPSISFEEAFTRWVQLDPSTAVQKTQVESGRIRETQAKLQFAPSLGVTGKTMRTGSSVSSKVSPGWQAVGTADLNLFRFGSDASDLSAAQTESLAQEALLEHQVLLSEADAVSVLTEWIARTLIVEVDQEFVKLREQSHEIAKQRYAQGLLAQQEVEKVQVDLENARSKLTDAQVRLAETQSTAESRLGSVRIRADWPWKKSDVRAPSIEGEHPKLRAVRFQAEAADSRVSAKRSRILPSLDANFTYGNYDGAAVGGVPAQRAWSGALLVTVPLFDRLVNYNEMKIQAQAREAANAKAQAAAYEVSAEKAAAKAAMTLAKDSAKRRENTLQISKRIYQDNLKRFRGGRITADELSIDQDRLLTSQLLEVEGWSALHKSLARFCHSFGARVGECVRESK